MTDTGKTINIPFADIPDWLVGYGSGGDPVHLIVSAAECLCGCGRLRVWASGLPDFFASTRQEARSIAQLAYLQTTQEAAMAVTLPHQEHNSPAPRIDGPADQEAATAALDALNLLRDCWTQKLSSRELTAIDTVRTALIRELLEGSAKL